MASAVDIDAKPATLPPAAARFAAGPPSKRLLLFTALLYMAISAGFRWAAAYSSFAGLIDLPAGCAMAALLLVGVRLWPAIAIGSSSVCLLAGESFNASIGTAFCHTAAVVIGTLLFRRLYRGDLALTKMRDALGFIVVCACLGPATSASLGALMLYATDSYAPMGLIPLARTWWLADIVGVLIVTPLFILKRPAADHPVRTHPAELAMIFAATAAIGVVVFNDGFSAVHYHYPLAYVVLPITIWSSLRCSQRIVASLNVITALLAVYGTAQGYGPFYREDAGESLIFLQTFLGVVSLTGILLSTVVTTRRQADALRELRLSEGRFRQMAESMPQIVWTAAPSGQVNYFNSRWYEYTGLPDGETKIDAPALLHPDDRDETLRQLRAAMRAQQQATLECRLRRADGSYRWHLSRTLPIIAPNGTISSWIATCTDIEDQKVAMANNERFAVREQATAEAARLKALFLANMSHEIRTPINGVLGMTTMLQDSGLGAEQQDYAASIQQSASVLLAVIDDLLDFTRVESGEVELDHIEFDLKEMVEQSLDPYMAEAARKGLTLIVSLPESTPITLRADPSCLRRVLVNLVANSVKFSDSGRIEVRLNFAADAEGRLLLLTQVDDQGIGIAEEVQQRLFQPFQQADSSSTRSQGGTGLGLSLCKHLVKLMQGSIGVTSALGVGSRFWFTATVERAVQAAHAPAAGLEAPPPRSLQGIRILLAEDNLINQRIALATLKKFGIKAEAVVNGMQVLTALELGAYDLILMDCQMPEMDGFEAARRIRASASRQRQIPIIALTANALKGDREACLAAGMNDYLTKPFRHEDLHAAIARWVPERQPHAAA